MRALIAPGGAAGGGSLTDEDLAQIYAAPAGNWLRVNMVSTLDGAATGESGRSGSINNAADHRVFHLLRHLCDAIIVGAGTARIEGYRPATRPLVVVSRSGAVPPLLESAPAGSVLLATCASSPGLGAVKEHMGEDVLVLGQDTVDLPALRGALSERGLNQLLCEGGPQLLGDLLASGLVDEVAATVVPCMIAGEHPRITAGAPVDVPLRLHSLLEQDGALLGRWLAVARAAP